MKPAVETDFTTCVQSFMNTSRSPTFGIGNRFRN